MNGRPNADQDGQDRESTERTTSGFLKSSLAFAETSELAG